MISQDLVKLKYKILKETFMDYEKLQLQQWFSSLKYAGFFVVASLTWITLTAKGIFSEYLTGIVCTGFGVLLVSALHMVFTASNIGYQLAKQSHEGKEMEEEHPTMIQSHYFQTIDSLKVSRYRLAAALCLVPFVFVGISTISAGVALAMRTSTNMAAVIGSISAAVLSIVVFFLARATKKRCLLRSEQGEKIR